MSKKRPHRDPSSQLLKSYKVASLRDGALTDLAAVPVQQRKTQIAERAALYAERLPP
jgi:hypothetical protein